MDSVWGPWYMYGISVVFSNGISINHRDLPQSVTWDVKSHYYFAASTTGCFVLGNLSAPGVGSRKGTHSIFYTTE